MKALFYHSPKDVQIDDKPPSNIQNPEDVNYVLFQLPYVVLTCIFITELYLGCNQDKR